MRQDLLYDLAILSVEREKFEMINFDDIIDKLVHQKQGKFTHRN